jgi:hypothetical protein
MGNEVTWTELEQAAEKRRLEFGCGPDGGPHRLPKRAITINLHDFDLLLKEYVAEVATPDGVSDLTRRLLLSDLFLFVRRKQERQLREGSCES